MDIVVRPVLLATPGTAVVARAVAAKKVAAPRWLSPAAAKVWPGMVKQIQTAGVVEQIDASALALYCESFVQWKNAHDKIEEIGTVIKSPSGYPVQSPYLAIANRAHDQMMKLLIQFGMTPMSRASRIKDGGKKEERQEAAKKVAGRFAQSAPPKLVAAGGKPV